MPLPDDSSKYRLYWAFEYKIKMKFIKKNTYYYFFETFLLSISRYKNMYDKMSQTKSNIKIK